MSREPLEGVGAHPTSCHGDVGGFPGPIQHPHPPNVSLRRPAGRRRSKLNELYAKNPLSAGPQIRELEVGFANSSGAPSLVLSHVSILHGSHALEPCGRAENFDVLDAVIQFPLICLDHHLQAVLHTAQAEHVGA